MDLLTVALTAEWRVNRWVGLMVEMRVVDLVEKWASMRVGSRAAGLVFVMVGMMVTS